MSEDYRDLHQLATELANRIERTIFEATLSHTAAKAAMLLIRRRLELLAPADAGPAKPEGN